jgi:hypothetical protein
VSNHTDSVADSDAMTATVAHVRKPRGAVEVLAVPFLENVPSCNIRYFFDKEEAYLWMCTARDIVPKPFEMMLSRRVLATLHRREEETAHAVGMMLDNAVKLIKEKARWCTEGLY